MSELVLVTGAYGYIASHCILQLLTQGHRVRGTLRKLETHEPGVRRIVAQAGAANDQLELVQADLEVDHLPLLEEIQDLIAQKNPIGANTGNKALAVAGIEDK